MMIEKTICNSIRLAVAASACLFLSACAGMGAFDPMAESKLSGQWAGHPVTDAMGRWGRPVSIKPDENGVTVYQWMSGKSYLYNQYVGSDTQYTGESVEYHSDGHITYSPNYETTKHYEQKRGDRICMLWAHVDSNSRIINLQTQDYDGGCGDFYSSASASPPDAASAAKGQVYADRFQAIKSISARYHATCTKPEYVALFEVSPCGGQYFKIAGARRQSSMTPEKTATLAKWSVEMNAIVNDYLAFFRGTGVASDKSIADSADSMWSRSKTRKNDSFLFDEQMTTITALQLEKYTKDAYGKFLN